jgi:hypothetical protein
MSILGMPRTLPGQLGAFMERLRQGNHSLTFTDPLNADLSQTFDSHAVLDVYIDNLLDRMVESQGIDPSMVDPNERIVLFKEKYPGDWELLVAFDRAFWTAYNSDSTNEPSKPRCKTVDGVEKEACPIEFSKDTAKMLARTVW